MAGPFAIEHTSIDTLPDQRLVDHWFSSITQPIEDVMNHGIGVGLLPFRLRIALAHDAITKGQAWSDIRQRLAEWIIKESSSLPEEVTGTVQIPGIPFPFEARREAGGSVPGVFFMRYEPQDESLSVRLCHAVLRKAPKLARYHAMGKTTILLVESRDGALMSGLKMLLALRDAMRLTLPAGVEHVWYADGSVPQTRTFIDFTRQLTDPDLS